jgi:hypothetical protein
VHRGAEYQRGAVVRCQRPTTIGPKGKPISARAVGLIAKPGQVQLFDSRP